MAGLIDQIPFLQTCLDGTDIELLELTSGAEILRLRRDGSTGGNPHTAAPDTLNFGASSPGIFRHAHPLHATPLAMPGRRVTEGEPVGLLQVGPLLIHLLSPADAIVRDVLAADGAVVGYGTTLLRLERDEE